MGIRPRGDAVIELADVEAAHRYLLAGPAPLQLAPAAYDLLKQICENYLHHPGTTTDEQRYFGGFVMGFYIAAFQSARLIVAPIFPQLPQPEAPDDDQHTQPA